MIQRILKYAVIAVALISGHEALARDIQASNDSVAIAIKLKGLQTKREKLQNEIKVQDAKRSRQIIGVSPETLEEMNDRQDSICLALRSELVDVALEIKELTTEVASPVLVQQYNNLMNKPQQSGNASSSVPGKKPTNKPTKQPAKKPKK